MWVINSFLFAPGFFWCVRSFFIVINHKMKNFPRVLKPIVRYQKVSNSEYLYRFFLDKSDNIFYIIRANSCVFFLLLYCRYMIVLLKWQLMWVWTFFYHNVSSFSTFLIGQNERSPHRKWKHLFFFIFRLCAFSLVYNSDKCEFVSYDDDYYDTVYYKCMSLTMYVCMYVWVCMFFFLLLYFVVG